MQRLRNTFRTSSARDLHKCTLEDHNNAGRQPTESLKWWEGFWRVYQGLIVYSEKSPRHALEMWPYKSPKEVIKGRERHLRDHKYIIHPMSMLRVYYEAFTVPVLMTVISLLPYHLIFRKDLFDPLGETLNSVLFVSIPFELLTGYVHKEHVILSQKKIFWHYILSIHFIGDLIPSMQLAHLTMETPYERLVNLMSLLRGVRIPTLLAYMDRTAEFFKVRNDGYRVLKFLFTCFTLFNWFACGFYAVPFAQRIVADSPDYKNNSWITLEDRLQDKSEFYQYGFTFTEAVFYVFGHQTHYDHVTRAPNEEQVMELSILIISYITRLILGAVILSYFNENAREHVKFHAKMTQLKDYLRQRQIPLDLQVKCVEYYEYKYRRKYFNESRVLMSDKLKKEANRLMCERLINSVDLFMDLPKDVLKNILVHLNLEIYLPFDEIIKAGSAGDGMYFLTSGTVAVYTPSMEEVCHLHAGAYFGEISLLVRDKKRTATIIAIDICEVYRLAKEPFRRCFQNRPELLGRLIAVAKQRHEEIILLEQFNYRL